ncbi:uncharacterized protein LOC143469081 [Clavelina lepadiformis]|uniref:uncharacterized protein LOC143469081 n=1 Tax=Clavelina lepadiformis TaxID=159417 RepID=UPI0040419F9A
MFRYFLVKVAVFLLFLEQSKCLYIGDGPGFQDYYNEAGTLVQRSGSPQIAASLLNISQPVKEVSTMGYLNSTTDNRTLVFTEGTTTQSNIEPTTNATDPKTTNRPQTTTDGPDGGLNTGEIVGIAVGATVGALIIIGAIVYVVKKNKKKNENKVSSTTSEIELKDESKEQNPSSRTASW